MRTTAVLAMVTLGTVLAGSIPAHAQSGGRLDLVAQTLFVTDEPAEIVLKVSGAPDDARLEFTILQTPLLTRQDVRAGHRGERTGGPRLSFFQCPLDGECAEAEVEFGTDGLITVTFDDELIGEALRQNPGALPVFIRLVDSEQRALDSLNTTLIVSDAETGEQPGSDLRVAFISRIDAPVALQADEGLDLDVDALFAGLSALESRAGLPVTVEIRPETVEALQQLHPERLQLLLDILDDRPLMRTPWVEMDEEAWRAAGESAQVVAQYARGNDTLETVIGSSPTGVVRLDPDANAATLGLLRTVGTSAVIVTEDQLSASSRARLGQHPFQLVDDNGVVITAVRIDADLHATLAQPDPELAGYQALAEIAIAAQSSATELATLLDVDHIDPAALDIVLAGISSRSELRRSSVAELLDLDLARTPNGALVRATLVPAVVPDIAALAGEIRTVEISINTLAAMIDPALDPIVGMRTRLMAAVADDLTAEQARTYPEAVLDEVIAGTTGLEIAPSDRITLTDRRTILPLTVVNRQPLPINVELLLSAEKLRFPDGDRLPLTLLPGETHLAIPVETLASGDARITATLISPGGLFELGSGTVDIRSTAISGLGLVISIVALLILGAWWIRTILRVRRNRAAATVAAASPDDHPSDNGPSEEES